MPRHKQYASKQLLNTFDDLYKIYDDYYAPTYCHYMLHRGGINWSELMTKVVVFSDQWPARQEATIQLTREREPVNIAMKRHYNKTKLASRFGYAHGAYDRIDNPPNIMIYSPTPFKGSLHVVHVLNAIAPALDSFFQPDAETYELTGGWGAFDYKQLRNTYRQLYTRVFDVAISLGFKTIVWVGKIGGNAFWTLPLQEDNLTFDNTIYTPLFQPIRQQFQNKIKIIETTYPDFNVHTDIAKISRNEANATGLTSKELDTTVFVNAWDPWSIVGNGNCADNSADGAFGCNSCLQFLTWPETNPHIQYRAFPKIRKLRTIVEAHGALIRDSKEFNGNAAKRVQVLQDTLRKIANWRSYYVAAANQMLSTVRKFNSSNNNELQPGILRVVSSDWGDAALQATKEFGKTFACLNMANARVFGGGYTDGMAAQEENMFRRSDCHFADYRLNDPIKRCIRRNKDGYAIYDSDYTDMINGRATDGMAYLDVDRPRICIKRNETDDYADLSVEDIFQFYELRSAAKDMRGLKQLFSKTDCMRRIRSQFEALKQKNVKHVILSAFGCGAFENPSHVVADCYRNVIQEYIDVGWVIIFAIYYPGYGPDNFRVFKEVLSRATSIQDVNTAIQLPNLLLPRNAQTDLLLFGQLCNVNPDLKNWAKRYPRAAERLARKSCNDVIAQAVVNRHGFNSLPTASKRSPAWWAKYLTAAGAAAWAIVPPSLYQTGLSSNAQPDNDYNRDWKGNISTPFVAENQGPVRSQQFTDSLVQTQAQEDIVPAQSRQLQKRMDPYVRPTGTGQLSKKTVSIFKEIASKSGLAGPTSASRPTTYYQSVLEQTMYSPTPVQIMKRKWFGEALPMKLPVRQAAHDMIRKALSVVGIDHSIDNMIGTYDFSIIRKHYTNGKTVQGVLTSTAEEQNIGNQTQPVEYPEHQYRARKHFKNVKNSRSFPQRVKDMSWHHDNIIPLTSLASGTYDAGALGTYNIKHRGSAENHMSSTAQILTAVSNDKGEFDKNRFIRRFVHIIAFWSNGYLTIMNGDLTMQKQNKEQNLFRAQFGSAPHGVPNWSPNARELIRCEFWGISVDSSVKQDLNRKDANGQPLINSMLNNKEKRDKFQEAMTIALRKQHVRNLE